MKVTIELRPYTALEILKLCRSCLNLMSKKDKSIIALRESVKEYQDEIFQKVTNEHLNDAILESRVNDITDRQPKKLN